jgi:hypothetical protein
MWMPMNWLLVQFFVLPVLFFQIRRRRQQPPTLLLPMGFAEMSALCSAFRVRCGLVEAISTSSLIRIQRGNKPATEK